MLGHPPTIQILQYNVQKRLNAVQIPLLNDPAVHQFDILALQEPGRNLSACETHNPSSLKFHLVNCPGQTFRTCIYVNKRIDTKTWSVEAVEDDYCSIRIAISDDSGAPKTLRLHNIYNPSPLSTTSTESPSTLPVLHTALAEHPSDAHLVVGDFNLHHPYWGGPRCLTRHAMADQLINTATNAGLDLLTPPGMITREMNQQRTTIDLTLGHEWVTSRLLKCGIREDLHQGSDHLPIATELQLQTSPTISPRRRLWKKMDVKILKMFLACGLPEERPLDTEDEIDKYASDIRNTIQEAVEESTPWARPSPFAKEFWTEQCTAAVAHARKKRADWQTSGTPEAWEAYTTATNAKGALIKRTRRAFFRTQAHEISKDPKSIFSLARWAKNKSFLPKDRPQFPPLKCPDGEGTAHEFPEKVDILRNKFFPPPPDVDLSDMRGFAYPEPLSEGPDWDHTGPITPGRITIEEVTKAIRRPKADKAPGVSQITSRVLQASIDELAQPLAHLFNACLELGYHPRIFKQANTIVLRKPRKPDYTDPKAYRPIALLDTIGKALESVIATRINDYAEEHNLLPKTQMGARRKRSTESALELLVEQIHTVWSGGNEHVASILSLDVAGAFDNVSHIRLLHNLRKRRIPTRIINWTQSFLKDRESCLSFDGSTSAMRPVHSGVPQGSPVSPILFLFFNADLLEECEALGLKASAIGFADDVNLLAYGRSTASNCDTLSRMHEVCMKWARTHGATFAPEKYELMHLSRKPGRFDMTAGLNIDTANIQPKADIRILGVQVDTRLRWGAHLRKIEGQNATQMLALSRLGASTWGATFSRARTIYTSVVRPAMTYAASIWHVRGKNGGLAGAERRLELLQNQGLRNVSGAFKKTSTRTLEAETYVPPIGNVLNRLQDQATLRLHHTGRTAETRRACEIIRAKLCFGARRRLKVTPGQCKNAHLLKSLGIARDAPSNPSSPLATGDSIPIGLFYLKQWEKEWETYRQRIPTALQTPAQRSPLGTDTIKMRSHLRKAESTLAMQIRTERIGLKAYLYSRNVPGYTSPECECGLGSQTARHVIMHCPNWTDLRERLAGTLRTWDYRVVIGSWEGLREAARLIMDTGLLEQFALAKTLLYGEV